MAIKGHQRGEVCISIVAQPEAVVAQTFYIGTKESEWPALVNLLIDNELLKRNIVLDALHLVSKLLDAIHHQKGTYLVGLKAYQQLVHQLCLIQRLLHKPVFERVDEPVRAHGRIEERTYSCYSMAGLATAKR